MRAGEPIEANVSAYFSQFAQPGVSDRLRVRFDPPHREHVEIDEAQMDADNAAAEAQVAAQAASALPADLVVSGIPGRATLARRADRATSSTPR